MLAEEELFEEFSDESLCVQLKGGCIVYIDRLNDIHG